MIIKVEIRQDLFKVITFFSADEVVVVAICPDSLISFAESFSIAATHSSL